jgi:hypothetical protein
MLVFFILFLVRYSGPRGGGGLLPSAVHSNQGQKRLFTIISEDRSLFCTLYGFRSGPPDVLLDLDPNVTKF